MKRQNNSIRVEKAVKKLIPVHFLLNRYAITLFNVVLGAILVLAFWDLFNLLLGNCEETDCMEKIMDGVGAIVVSYGIVLEERESIMQIFGYYPKNKYQSEILTDQICFDAGIILLVLGLLIEVITQFQQIPNTIINTEGREPIIFSTGLVLLFITILHFLVFCYKLLTLKHQQASSNAK